MPNLIIRKKVDLLTSGTWKWSESDYQRPLTFQLDGAQSQIFIEQVLFQFHRDIQIEMNFQFVLFFKGAPPAEYISALKSKGDKSTKFAQRIYDYYLETLTRFEGILRDSGKIRNLWPSSVETLHNFYYELGLGGNKAVTWQIDDLELQVFKPKLPTQPRGKNPLFKHPQLVTVEKWEKFQKYINAGRFPSEEILELHRLAGKVHPKSKRLQVVETAIIVESKLKSYAEMILPNKGFSKSKIKELRSELSFNTVLNLVLPLTLNKTDLKRINKWRPLIDRIRKVRNDIVHNDLSDTAISEKEVLDGIYAAMDLFDFIDSKLK